MSREEESGEKPARKLRGVFLDRDGVINRERGHVRCLQDFEILPGVPEAVARLNRAGVRVAVLTNQSGIARGILTEETLAGIHAFLGRTLAEAGARIDFLAYSPWLDRPGLPGGVERFLRDHPDRKPNPGMIDRARSELGLAKEEVCYLGDTARDREAASRAGVAFHAIRSAKAGEFEGSGVELFDSLAAWVDRAFASGWVGS